MNDINKKIKTRIKQAKNIYNIFNKLQKESYTIKISNDNKYDKDLKYAYIYNKNIKNYYKNNYDILVIYKDIKNTFELYQINY